MRIAQVLVDADGNLIVIDCDTASMRVASRRFDEVTTLALATDKRMLAVAQRDGHVEILDLENDTSLKSMALTEGVRQTVFSQKVSCC